MVPGSIKSPRHPIYKDQLQNIRMEKRPRQMTHTVHKNTKTYETLGQTRKTTQTHKSSRPNTKSPSQTDLTPGPSPMGRGEHASQTTKKLHQNPTSPPAPLPWGEGCMLHKKNSPKPDLTPGPSPMGRGEHASQKTKKLTKPHKKAPPLQRPKPHHLMNCERAVRHRRAALSQFGGRGGTGPPPKKLKTLSSSGV